MKKFVITVVVSMLSVFVSYAVLFQTTKLKNGSVLNGYIQQQDVNDNIKFCTENATICIDGGIAEISDNTYKISQLDPEWIKWAEDNDAFEGVGDDRVLVLSDVRFKQKDATEFNPESVFENEFIQKGRTARKVKVLEKGATVRFLQMTEDSYPFNWSEVESITSKKRLKTDLSGIDRTYQLSNGHEVTGQYAGESYSTLSLYTNGGVVETFELNDVQKNMYKGINPDQSIFEQSILLDIVHTNNGTYRGVITERNFTPGSDYLIINQYPSGSTQLIKFSDVSDYSKEVNPSYSPKHDILLSKGELVINRLPTDTVDVRKQGQILILDSINSTFVIPTGGTGNISVEYYNPNRTSSDNLLMVKLTKYTKKKDTYYGFSTDIYEMKKVMPVRSEISVNNTSKIDYVLPSSGVYAIYDQINKKAIPFTVK